MVDDTNVTITEETIDVTLSDISFDAHSTTHEAGGTDEINLDQLNVAGPVDLQGNDLVDGTLTIYDESVGEITSDALPDSVVVGVSSFEGRTGDVVSQAGDYDHAEIANINSDDHHVKTQPTDINSANWDDYEIQKNGTDGQGIINFKT